MKPLAIADEIREDLIFKFYYRSLAEGQDKGHGGAGAVCVKGVCPGTHLESPLLYSALFSAMLCSALAACSPLSFWPATCIVFLQASSAPSTTVHTGILTLGVFIKTYSCYIDGCKYFFFSCTLLLDLYLKVKSEETKNKIRVKSCLE